MTNMLWPCKKYYMVTSLRRATVPCNIAPKILSLPYLVRERDIVARNKHLVMTLVTSRVIVTSLHLQEAACHTYIT